MLEWLYRLYSVKEKPIQRCDLVVALGYGLLEEGHLPDAAKKSIEKAVSIANRYNVRLAWASSNYFWPGSDETEDKLKWEQARVFGLSDPPIMAGGVTNTVTEAQAIKEAVEDELKGKTVVVVADWIHSPSVVKVWKHVLPEMSIVLSIVRGSWNEPHLAFFQRSELRWLLINIFRHLALMILGTRVVSLIHQPTSKKGV